MADITIPRLKTGIPGLDPLIEGGVLHRSVNLVTGETGTGKTIFSCQFLWHGLQKGETGVYITLEEDPEDIKEDAKQFGWDFQKYIEKDLFRIIYHDPAQINNLSSVLIDEIRSLKAKRLVIDSTSVMGLAVKDAAQIRISSLPAQVGKCGPTQQQRNQHRGNNRGLEDAVEVWRRGVRGRRGVRAQLRRDRRELGEDAHHKEDEKDQARNGHISHTDRFQRNRDQAR